MLPKFGLWILNSSDPPSKSGINHLIKCKQSGLGHPSNLAKFQIKIFFFFEVVPNPNGEFGHVIVFIRWGAMS